MTMVRKKRGWITFISCSIVNYFLIALCYNTPDILFLIWFVLSIIVTFECIKALSTYDITSWGDKTHTYIIMYAGCIFGLLGGAVSYYALRNKELKLSKGDV